MGGNTNNIYSDKAFSNHLHQGQSAESVNQQSTASSYISRLDSDSDDEIDSSNDSLSVSSNGSAAQRIATKENSSVVRWKVAFRCMLIIIAATMIIHTKVFLSIEETKRWQLMFFQHGTQIQQTFLYREKKLLDYFQSKADDISSIQSASGETWPFVTIPDMEILCNNSFAETIAFSPIILSGYKDVWAKYSKRKQGWIKENLQYYNQDQQDQNEKGVIINNESTNTNITDIDPGEITDYIYYIRNEEKVKETGWWIAAPLWQISPPPINASIVNFNFVALDTVKSSITEMVDRDRAVFSARFNATFINDHIYHDSSNTGDGAEQSNLVQKYDFGMRNVDNDFNNRRQRRRIQYNNVVEMEMGIDMEINKRNTETTTITTTKNDIYRPNYKTRNNPRSLILQPIYDSNFDDTDRTLVGVLIGVVLWDSYFAKLFQDRNSGIGNDASSADRYSGIIGVITNTCDSDDVYSYEFDISSAIYLGVGDQHDTQPDYDDLRMSFIFKEFFSDDKKCQYIMYLYPSDTFRSHFKTHVPYYASAFMLIIFIMMYSMFSVFVRLVDERQETVMTTATRATAIVSSLYPSNVRDRIMLDTEEKSKDEKSDGKYNFFAEAAKRKLKAFIDEDHVEADENIFLNSKPIADLFPNATVLFADLVGFTAWSSVREPSQVFQLLETIYHSFDMVAKRRRVFKVETIGDCYVAVTGLPEPRKDHAVIMARFARECMIKLTILVKKMEVYLGPDTGELSMRLGLHSGPVTAGVLRGEKSRFQLFGDTVNTAARMESNGERGKMHVSQDTADLLIAAGKSKWVTPREGTINAKGKGEMKTFWVQITGNDSQSCDLTTSSFSDNNENASQDVLPSGAFPSINEELNMEMKSLPPKMQRLVDWNADQLSRLLKAVIAKRNARKLSSSFSSKYDRNILRSGTVLEEVKEVITLPNFDGAILSIQDPESVELPEEVVQQLHDYVTKICMMYRNNSFHNFEHASHVSMSVSKLLSRIVAPDEVVNNNNDDSSMKTENLTKKFASALHDCTYGITSDPLTQFSCVFSALIHDVDHTGVPNAQLVQESTSLATRYKNKSVAEQNSVDLAWKLLMDENYASLRRCIYANESEFERFRQLVVNVVMATDICDKELKMLRDGRWNKAFNGKVPVDLDEDRNRKATIVIEHLIQASDVAHTMQHWHVYRKWNERLFREQYLAFKAGRADVDPVDIWYKGEIGFYDFYIIPLAKKLKDCGVFGVSSDEYLNYAVKNREEWEVKGEEVVKEMLRKVEEDEAAKVKLV